MQANLQKVSFSFRAQVEEMEVDVDHLEQKLDKVFLQYIFVVLQNCIMFYFQVLKNCHSMIDAGKFFTTQQGYERGMFGVLSS